MKILLLGLAALSFTATANEDVEDVDRETLFDVYEFCVNEQGKPQPNLTLLLSCINRELDSMGYKRFSTLDTVEEKISDYPSK